MKIEIAGPQYKYTIDSWFFTNRKLKKLGLHKCVNVPGIICDDSKKNTAHTLSRLKAGYKAVVMLNGRAVTLRTIESKLTKFLKCLF